MIVSNWYHSQPIASDKITIHLLLCSNPMVVVHLLENNLASSSWSYFHISRQRYEKHFLLTLIWGIVPYLGKSWPLFGTMCSLFGIVKFRANLHTPYWPIIPRILPYVIEISWPNTLAGEDVAKKKTIMTLTRENFVFHYGRRFLVWSLGQFTVSTRCFDSLSGNRYRRIHGNRILKLVTEIMSTSRPRVTNVRA